MATENIESEVTGTVWKIEGKVGDEVVDGDTLIIPVICPEDGTITEIKVKEEDPVAEGDVVVILEVQ